MPDLLTVDDLLALPAAPPDAELTYGDDAEQFGHLYLPNTPGPYPVIVLLHGGCWRSGVDLSYFGQGARALSEKGIAVWNLDYRCVGNGGGWPNTFLDVAMGTDFLREIASKYALDLDRVIAMGHSAGGHLALWLAARSSLKPQDELFSQSPLVMQGVVSLAGIPDLTEAHRQGVCKEMPSALIGALPEEKPERYRQASPAALLPVSTPQVLVQGVRDETVPLAYVEAYWTRARRYDRVDLVPLEQTGHYEIVVPGTWQWEQVVNHTLDLFKHI